jgi:hypothetical protein
MVDFGPSPDFKMGFQGSMIQTATWDQGFAEPSFAPFGDESGVAIFPPLPGGDYRITVDDHGSTANPAPGRWSSTRSPGGFVINDAWPSRPAHRRTCPTAGITAGRHSTGPRASHGSAARNLVAVASSENPIAYSSSPDG